MAKKSGKKPASKTATANKVTAKKKVAKKKADPKKTAKKKVASKKKTKKKTTTKKSSTKKSSTKKTPDKKPTKRKTAAKKSAPKSKTKKTSIRRKRSVAEEDIRSQLDSSWAAITEQREHVLAVFEEHHDHLLSHPDVCGAHVGLKRKSGKVVYPMKYVIRLHVAKKWPKGHPMLRQEIDVDQFKDQNVEIDVMERSYRLLSTDGETEDDSNFIPGPFTGGRPIAPNDFPDHWGTMGMIVFFGGQPHYLTNEHVAGKPGTSIRESEQGLTASGNHGIVGNVVNSIRNSTIDCAIIAPSGNRRKSLGIIGPDGLLPGIYVPRKLTSVDEHRTEVFKIGARTGFKPIRVGVVKNINTSIEISGMQMTGQIIVESTDDERIIAPGDSGSIALVKGEQNGTTINFVVGLVHAETVSTTESGEVSGRGMVANHFENVESALRISLFPA